MSRHRTQTTSHNCQRHVGENQPRRGDCMNWARAIRWLVDQLGTQTATATLIGENEQAIRRWTNLDAPQSPSINDASETIDRLQRRRPDLVHGFLRALIGTLFDPPASVSDQMRSLAHTLETVASDFDGGTFPTSLQGA